jgi:hypothetical protein
LRYVEQLPDIVRAIISPGVATFGDVLRGFIQGRKEGLARTACEECEPTLARWRGAWNPGYTT